MLVRRGEVAAFGDIFLPNFTESLTGRLGIDEFAEVGDGLNARGYLDAGRRCF